MFVLNATIEWTEANTMFFSFKVITVATEIAHEDKCLTAQPFSGNNPRCSTPSGLRRILYCSEVNGALRLKNAFKFGSHLFALGSQNRPVLGDAYWKVGLNGDGKALSQPNPCSKNLVPSQGFGDCIPVWLFALGGKEHLDRRSSRALIFLVFCSVVGSKSYFSCLTSRKSFFNPVMTYFRLFDCSTLNWSNSILTPALHRVHINVPEQHSSVEWSTVTATSAEDTPQTEVLAASETKGVLIVMTAPALSLPDTETHRHRHLRYLFQTQRYTVLSLSLESE